MSSRLKSTLLSFIVITALLAGCATTANTPDDEAVVAAAVATIQPQNIGTLPISYSGSTSTSAADLESTLMNLYATANPSVVYIEMSTGSGSGFVYSEEGYIVTNNHVVANGGPFLVVFSNGDQQYADLVGADVDSDLAVLRVESIPQGVSALPLAASDSLSVGQFVAVIGSPFGEQGSMSMGIVSATGRSLSSQRTLETGGTYSLPNVIQTDAPINPGNSGGPLLNLNGEVVGITSAIATTSGTNSGVGFAIPVEAVARIIPALIANGEYDYSYIGASFDKEVSLSEMETYGLNQTQGAYVFSVSPGSPAADAGLIGANAQIGQGGDLIIKIDDQPITNFGDLNNYLVFHTAPGQDVQLTILRDGETITIPLTLAARP